MRIFNERVPEHAQQLHDIIAQAHHENKKFQAVVRESLNPALQGIVVVTATASPSLADTSQPITVSVSDTTLNPS